MKHKLYINEPCISILSYNSLLDKLSIFGSTGIQDLYLQNLQIVKYIHSSIAYVATNESNIEMHTLIIFL